MTFVSGFNVVCLCGSATLTTVEEHFDAVDRIFVGTQTCDGCGARMLYSRRPSTLEEKAMAKKSAKKKPSAKTPRAKRQAAVASPRKARPRNRILPGLEDSAIKPLEDIAASYADIRDQRIELNRSEVELKATAIKLMHKYGKTIYRRDGIEIRLIEGDEDVKVKVKKAGEDDEAPLPAEDLPEEAGGEGPNFVEAE